jgi:hypothetical protein
MSRKCDAILNLLSPAPESLAAKERDRQANELEQASAAPQDTQSTKLEPRQSTHAAIPTQVAKPATKPQQFVAAKPPSVSSAPQNPAAPLVTAAPPVVTAAPPADYAGSAGKLGQAQQADPTAGLRATAAEVALRDKFTQRLGADDAEHLFIGNDGDLLLFSNETPQAPYAARRITGELYFRDKKMVVCPVAEVLKIDGQFAQYATRTLTKMYPDLEIQPANPWNTTCGPTPRFDIYAVLRSDLISHSNLQEWLATALYKKYVRWFGRIDRSPFDMLVAQREDNEKRAQAQLLSGTLDGLGLLATDSQNYTVCALNNEDREFVSRIVQDIDLGIVFDKKPGEKPDVKIAAIDDIFLDTKANRCGFIFGDGKTLKMFVDALSRDGYDKVHLIPVIVPRDRADTILATLQSERRVAQERMTNDQTEQAQAAAAAERKLAEQRAADLQLEVKRQEELADQEKLKAVRRKNDEVARREELQRMRNVVASRGRAVVDTLDQRLRKQIASVVQEVADTKKRAQLGQILSVQDQRALMLKYSGDRMETEFPLWSTALLKSVKEEWEYGDIQASLEDYGQAKWKSRNIEAIAVRVEFPITNKLIGERKTDCTIFVWINDEEFSFWRQPASFECENYDAAFKDWALNNNFISQWKLQPE